MSGQKILVFQGELVRYDLSDANLPNVEFLLLPCDYYRTLSIYQKKWMLNRTKDLKVIWISFESSYLLKEHQMTDISRSLIRCAQITWIDILLHVTFKQASLLSKAITITFPNLDQFCINRDLHDYSNKRLTDNTIAAICLGFVERKHAKANLITLSNILNTTDKSSYMLSLLANTAGKELYTECTPNLEYFRRIYAVSGKRGKLPSVLSNMTNRKQQLFNIYVRKFIGGQQHVFS